MKFFTPNRYLALQHTCDEAALDAAEMEWEDTVDQYDAHLKSIRPKLPENVRELLDGYYLHDAIVLSMGRNDDKFVIALQLDTPPNELLTLTYDLAAEPEITYVFPEEFCSETPEWLCDEFHLADEPDETTFVHSVLLSNGWELRLQFRELATTIMEPMYPEASVKADASSV